MKNNGTRSGLLTASGPLSVLIASVLSAGTVAADNIDDMISGLEKSLQPAKPLKPTTEVIDHAMSARKSFGFKSDREFVKQLLTNPGKFGALSGPLTGGHYATPDEVEELKIRLVLQEDAIALSPALSDDPDFAGIYINNKNVIKIGFTVGADKKVEELRNKVNLPERLQAFSAERSMLELETSKNRVVQTSEELTAEGIVISRVGIDIENNIIQIGVVDLDPKKQEIIQQLFGKVDVVEKPLNEVENRADTASPIRAGVRITNASGGPCTSSWKAQDRTTGEYVMIAAGHCVPDVNGTLGGPGAAFFQGVTGGGAARQVGVSDQTTWTFPGFNPATGGVTGSNPVDALRTTFDSGIGSSAWLYAYDNANSGVFGNGEEARIGAVDGTVIIGSAVCSGGQFSPGNQVGGNSWKNCGTVSAVNVANVFNRQPGSPDKFTLLNSNEADYIGIGGDSGAPTWRIGYEASSGWHAIAVGHHSGGPTGSEIFNDIDRVENALNVDIRFY